MEILAAIIGLLGAVVGAILGAILTHKTSKRISKETYRNNLTYEIVKYFNSQEFLYILQVLQEIKYTLWKEEKGKKLVNFFIPVQDLDRPEEEVMKNDLTVHQNLTLYLRFLSQIYWYLKDNSVNKDLIQRIIIHEHYSWYRDFFNDFIEEYERVCKENLINPNRVTWYSALKEFNLLL